jgi:hypothetical protein
MRIIVPSAEPVLSQTTVALELLVGRNEVMVELVVGSALPVVAFAPGTVADVR